MLGGFRVESRFFSGEVLAVLHFKKLWNAEPKAVSNAIGYAEFCSRWRDGMIRKSTASSKREEPRKMYP
jgi:hypothetical protein